MIRTLQPLEAVIHIGPHKTGSTSIETALIINQRIRRALEQDGYAVPDQFPGIFPIHSAKNPANLANELRQPGPADGATWRWVAAYANHSFASGKNLLVATESLSTFVPAENLEQLATMLTKDVGYAVRVVMVYWREYQRLVSLHTQVSIKEVQGNVSCYLPLVEYLERDGGVPHKLYQSLARKFRGLGRVELLNLHTIPNGSSLVHEFVCRHLHAPRACAALRFGSARATTMNDGLSRALNAPLFDVILGAARAGGVGQIDLQKSVRIFHRFRLRGRPELADARRCINAATMERLWAETKAAECFVLSRRLSVPETAALHADFSAHASQYCSVNVDRLRHSLPTLDKAVRNAVKVGRLPTPPPLSALAEAKRELNCKRAYMESVVLRL